MGLAILLTVSGSAIAAEPSTTPPEFVACPGASEWFAAEDARRRALQLPTESEPTDPALRDELLRMEKADQEARADMSGDNGVDPEANARMRQVDSHNLQKLKQILAAEGFPSASRVGRNGVAAIWLLIQHADSDPGFQEGMLGKILTLTEADGIDLQKIALLTDRVLVARGKPQRYGSQFLGGMGEPLVMRPVEAPDQLDRRRVAMHLMSAATYKCMLEETQKAER